MTSRKAVEAYMDLYQITGRELYINAVDGFVEMFAVHFLHLGGTVQCSRGCCQRVAREEFNRAACIYFASSTAMRVI
jgi:hypothetical protein